MLELCDRCPKSLIQNEPDHSDVPYIRDLPRSRYPLIRGRSEADFIRQLDYIAAHFTVVRAEDVIAAANGAGSLPENAVWLTSMTAIATITTEKDNAARIRL